jgi:hypothetical protein
VVRRAGVARLLDPGQQEYAVVGCEAEPDRSEEDRLRRVERPSWKISTRIPNTALRLSTFITIALIGRTTDPVKRNSTIRVAAMITASTAGR